MQKKILYIQGKRKGQVNDLTQGKSWAFSLKYLSLLGPRGKDGLG